MEEKKKMSEDLVFKIKKVDIKNKVILLELPIKFEEDTIKSNEVNIPSEFIF